MQRMAALDCWNRKGAVTMNNIETLHTIYIATMTAGIIMLVITIVLFFLFDIRHVVGRLFGFSEKKKSRNSVRIQLSPAS